VAPHWVIHETIFNLIEAELNGIIPIPLFGFYLCDITRPRLDDGAGDHLPLLIKDARHSKFLA